MEKLKYITTILNSSIDSLKGLLPMSVNIQSPSLITEPYSQKELGVLIGLIGDLNGKIMIDSQTSTFREIGTQMFGMPIEGELLESFTGEFGNMFAGKLCTLLDQHSLELDITTPTVMTGTTKLNSFMKAFKLPATIDNVGELNILLTIDEI